MTDNVQVSRDDELRERLNYCFGCGSREGVNYCCNGIDLPAVVIELLEARTILHDIAITEPAMSDGMCAWCLAGLTSGDEHSETCLWWRSRAFLYGTEDRPGGEDG